jgi:hypothetical protein
LKRLAGGLLRACRERGIPLETHGAVSPLDSALAALGLSLGLDVRAVQACDAAALPGRVKPLGHWLIASCDGKDARGALKALSKTFGRRHPCWLVREGEDALSSTIEDAAAAVRGRRGLLVLPPR